MKARSMILLAFLGLITAAVSWGAELVVVEESEASVLIEVRRAEAEQINALALHGSAQGLSLPTDFDKGSNTTVTTTLEDGRWLLLLGTTEATSPIQEILGGEHVLLRGELAKTAESWSLLVESLDLMEAGGGVQFAVMGMPVEEGQFGDESASASLRFEVFPNPGGAEFHFSFAANRERVASVRIYDLQGRLVRDLRRALAMLVESGGELTWDGRNDRGESASAGVYFARVSYNTGGEASQKLILIR